MKTLSLIAASIVAATAASAADLPRRQAVPVAIMAPAPISSWTGFYAGGHLGYFGSRSLTPSAGGGFGGLQAGYDHQFGSFVAGLAGDYSLANVRGSDALVGVIGKNAYTLRARLGYAFNPQFMVYVTGGYAGLTLDATDYFLNTKASYKFGGAVLGLGGEYKFDRNWAAFAEYRSLETKNSSLSGNLKANDFRVGVNYRF